jgi:hypothetical protein
VSTPSIWYVIFPGFSIIPNFPQTSPALKKFRTPSERKLEIFPGIGLEELKKQENSEKHQRNR